MNFSLQQAIAEVASSSKMALAVLLLLGLFRSGVLPDLSLCLLHGTDTGQPFLCEPQSSGET